MALQIRQYGPVPEFDLYSVVKTLLVATGGIVEFGVSAHWSLTPDPLGYPQLSVEGSDLAVDGAGEITSGIITSLQWHGVTFSGFSLDVATALLSPLGSLPLADNVPIDYSAENFQPRTDSNSDIIPTGVIFFGGALNDTLRGGSVNDTLGGGAGDDHLYGGDGADWLVADPGRDTIDGGKGYDVIDFTGLKKAVEVHLDTGNLAPVRIGGVVEDKVRNIEVVLGGTKADSITGDWTGNTLIGQEGKDTLDGGGGYDIAYYTEKAHGITVTLNGSSLASVKVGSSVEDRIRNIEAIAATGHDDHLTGDRKANTFYGEGGYDTLSGGAGNDLLVGGSGKDVLRGGAGYDEFLFDDRALSKNADVIVDFEQGKDIIALDGNVYTSLYSGHLFASQFRIGTEAKDRDDFIIYDSNTGRLYYDDDGSGRHAPQLVLTIANHHDFQLDRYLAFEVLEPV